LSTPAAEKTAPAAAPTIEDAPKTPPAEVAQPSVEKPPEVPATEPAASDSTEFDPIIPELAAGGTVRLGKTEFQLKSERDPGVELKVRPVRTRQMLAIGRVLTGATRPLNLHAMISPIMLAETADEQTAAFIAAFTNLLLTVPHSEREFINLTLDLVDPVSQMDDNEHNSFYEYMTNPEIEDTVLVFVQMYKNEEPRMRDLGKALMTMFPQMVRRPVEATPGS